MSFSDQLSLILEEPTGQNPLDAATGIIQQLNLVKQKLLDLRHQLNSLTRRMNGDLALGVRRHMPGLNVSINSAGCKVGYRSKALTFNPDLEKGVWIVTGEDNRFTKRFMKLFGKYTKLLPDIGDIVESITNYFMNHYKSLGEEIVGTGIVLIEGKKSSLVDLVQRRDFHVASETLVPPQKRLNTRMARRVG